MLSLKELSLAKKNNDGVKNRTSLSIKRKNLACGGWRLKRAFFREIEHVLGQQSHLGQSIFWWLFLASPAPHKNAKCFFPEWGDVPKKPISWVEHIFTTSLGSRG